MRLQDWPTGGPLPHISGYREGHRLDRHQFPNGSGCEHLESHFLVDVHADFLGEARRATTSNGASAAAMDAVSLNGGNDAASSAALNRAATAAGMCFLTFTEVLL